MGKWTKVYDSLCESAANVRFEDLCGLVEHLGFVAKSEATSHRVYRHPERPEIPLINLQRDRSGKAKPYQVRQVRWIVETYELEVAQ